MRCVPQRLLGAFVQDDWKVTETDLQYRLRWDLDTPRWEGQPQSSFDGTVINPWEFQES
jgi:hypothetical protein